MDDELVDILSSGGMNIENEVDPNVPTVVIDNGLKEEIKGAVIVEDRNSS